MNEKIVEIISVVLLVLAALAWFFRWEVVPITNSEGRGSAYVINRWTGAVFVLVNTTKIEVNMDK